MLITHIEAHYYPSLPLVFNRLCLKSTLLSFEMASLGMTERPSIDALSSMADFIIFTHTRSP